MKPHHLLFTVTAAAALTSCSPRVGIMPSRDYPPRDPAEPVAFVFDRKAIPFNALNLDRYSERTQGDSATVLMLARLRTQSLGGNAFYISKMTATSVSPAVYDLSGVVLRMPDRLVLTSMPGSVIFVDSTALAARKQQPPPLMAQDSLAGDDPTYDVEPIYRQPYTKGKFYISADIGFGTRLARTPKLLDNIDGTSFSTGFAANAEAAYLFAPRAQIGAGAAVSYLRIGGSGRRERGETMFIGPVFTGSVRLREVAHFHFAVGLGYFGYNWGYLDGRSMGGYLAAGLDFMFSDTFGVGIKAASTIGPFSNVTSYVNDKTIRMGKPGCLSSMSLSVGARFKF